MGEARRCTARNRRGEPCGRFAVAGAVVCRFHGAAAPQVAAAARRRVVEAEAAEVVRRVLGSPAATGIGDPTEALLDLAGRLRAALDALQLLVEARGGAGSRTTLGGESLTAELDAWLRVSSELRGVLAILVRAELDTRLVRVQEAQAGQVAAAFRELLAGLKAAWGLDEEREAEAHSHAVVVLRGLADGRWAS